MTTEGGTPVPAPVPAPAPGEDPRQAFFDSLTTIDRNADISSLQAFSSAMYTVSSGAIDRARASADTVQKSSAAIATLYTGILALVFSIASKPLPLRGALTPIFLGASVVLAAVYMAYLGPVAGDEEGSPAPSGPEVKTFDRINLFIRVTSAILDRRSGFLRAGVVALGVGLACIPAPLITLGQTQTAAVPTAPPWPTPAPTASDNATASSPANIVFQAQVNEVANIHNKIISRPEEVSTTWDVGTFIVGLIVGTGLIIGVTYFTRPRRT